MKKGRLIVCSPSPGDNSSLNSSLLTYDLPILIEKMKHSNAWTKGELNTKILLESPDKQILLTTLHEETEINSFQKYSLTTREETVLLSTIANNPSHPAENQLHRSL